MSKLTINGIITQAAAGATLFDCAEVLGIRVPTSCHKQGKCKECMMEILEGADCLSPRVEAESHLPGHLRLSCRAQVTADSGAIRCHTMRRGQMRIVTGALGPQASRLHSCRSGHGLAIDLGTTTIVLRLYNLETGEQIAAASFENPQRFGGSEVMSRIRYDTERRGKLLMRTLAGYLSHAIEEFPVDTKAIREVVVAGNSTMRDLFFRLNVASIGQAPYRSITEIEKAAGLRTTTSLSDTGARCLLPVHPKAQVYGLPIISGHVGADAAACMLAVDLAHEDRLVAIMDIGTNTEIILGNKDRIFAASCPAGPAFEGGGITCGMPALEGAIEDLTLDVGGDGDGRFRLGVIGGGAPEGLAGSGLVDLLSELIRTGRMNELGRFENDVERITLDPEHNIFLLESDVNELAQAKSANVAGLRAVFDSYGVDFDALSVFYLAGGFGSHLKTEAARRIGLIPDLPDSKIVPLGNGAIEGASAALLDPSKRQELEKLVEKVQHCRLETHPSFFDFFVEGCQFKPLKAMVAR